MAEFKEVTTPIVNTERVISENVISHEVEAIRYIGLPVASVGEYGIIKVDGSTIKVDENGVISASLLFDEDNVSSHINDYSMHIKASDRDNLERLDGHINSSLIHFTVNEKEDMINSIEELSEHMNLPHLSQNEASTLKRHINESYLHFDNQEQKDRFLLAANNSVVKNQGIPNRLLITNNEGNVELSKVPSSVLESLPVTDKSLLEFLADYFAPVGSGGSADGVYDHAINTEVHFTSGEKNQVLEDIENLKLDRGFELFATKDDLLDLCLADHRHDTTEIKHDSSLLHTVIEGLKQDIKDLKDLNIETSIRDLSNKYSNVNSDISILRNNLSTLSDRLNNIEMTISSLSDRISVLESGIQ